MGAEKQATEKSDFIFLLIDIELLHAQNDIAFVLVASFSPYVCKLATVAVLASCGSAKF